MKNKEEKRWMHYGDDQEEKAMDWYSWLSKTSLDPSHIYEYGLSFTRNELKKEDLRYFDHEFLQSMGISVAKHRLEILKLAKKEGGVGSNGLTRFVVAINKTKKLLARNIHKLVPHSKNSSELVIAELSPYRAHWSGALRKLESSKELKKFKSSKELKFESSKKLNQERALIPCKSTLNSGPLDRKVQEKLTITNRPLSVSGPLDGKVQERLMLPSCSPLPWGGKVKERMVFPTISPSKSGPLDAWNSSPKINGNNQHKDMMKGDDGAHSLWSLMFQDMKPT